MARLLAYTRTTGYRHDSIPAGAGALRGADGFSVDATEDPAVFRAWILRHYAAIVFLSTSGEVLDDAGRERRSPGTWRRAAHGWASMARRPPNTAAPGSVTWPVPGSISTRRCSPA
jgi:hypothetical protein